MFLYWKKNNIYIKKLNVISVFPLSISNTIQIWLIYLFSSLALGIKPEVVLIAFLSNKGELVEHEWHLILIGWAGTKLYLQIQSTLN